MNLAVFLPNWIGDVVMATPALRALRRHFRGATMVGVLRPYVAGVLEDIRDRRHLLRGLRMTYAPKVLRHFSARFEEIAAPVEQMAVA